jgi:hypothetical protein
MPHFRLPGMRYEDEIIPDTEVFPSRRDLGHLPKLAKLISVPLSTFDIQLAPSIRRKSRASELFLLYQRLRTEVLAIPHIDCPHREQFYYCMLQDEVARDIQSLSEVDFAIFLDFCSGLLFELSISGLKVVIEVAWMI